MYNPDGRGFHWIAIHGDNVHFVSVDLHTEWTVRVGADQPKARARVWTHAKYLARPKSAFGGHPVDQEVVRVGIAARG